jgi:hypothetical protein
LRFAACSAVSNIRDPSLGTELLAGEPAFAGPMSEAEKNEVLLIKTIVNLFKKVIIKNNNKNYNNNNNYYYNLHICKYINLWCCKTVTEEKM